MHPSQRFLNATLSAAAAIVCLVAPLSAAELIFGEGRAEPDPLLSLPTPVVDWHKDAVVYHLWVAAFRDSDGDGTGDLRGIISELDGLKAMGVDSLWLSPFFENASGPRNLHGYDVTDHFRVDPRFGTNDDARDLVRESHARGMRLVFDFVPNHVSHRHPWFVDSRDASSPKREWFLWRESRPESGWTGFDGRSDWHADPGGGGFYYGIFWSGMPDLNHRHPEVRQALAAAARFWLDMGFDGIRMDAVKYLFENTGGRGEMADQEDLPESIAWFESWRREVMDPYAEKGFAKFMVAENWTENRRSLEKWFSHEGRPSFHMTLNFPLLPALVRLDPLLARDVWEWGGSLPEDAWLGNFASNHDMAADRPGTLFAERPDQLRAQAAWLMLGPGTPFLYYGNEIGQRQGSEAGDRRHRHPLDWDEVARQRADPDSLWHWHRRLAELRRAHASLRRGKPDFLTTDAASGILAIWRMAEGDATLTVINGTAELLEGLTVQLPAAAPAGAPRRIFGNAAQGVAGGGTLKVGPLAAHEVAVFAFPRD
jgi:alpha-amylase